MSDAGGLRLFRSTRVVTPDGERAAAVLVKNGKIDAVQPHDFPGDGAELVELGEVALLPGFVDSHVHVNEPGRTEWEGFETATRAAAAGGVTTIVDMPLNSVPATTSAAALGEKLHAADGRLWVDVAFWGGVVPGNLSDLTELHAGGVAGFKCFLAPSGVEEFQHVSASEMEEAMRVLAGLDLPLLVHAEDPGVLQRAPAVETTRSASVYMTTRPVEAEMVAARAALAAAERTGARVHIVHAASAAVVDAVHLARARGVRATVETCPHYLFFATGEIPDGATEWKCAPPIRDREERTLLRDALSGRRIDLVASDHSPAPPELKHAGGDFMRAWGGIASLQLAPRATWTVARQLGCGLADLARWCSSAPASLASLTEKGSIAAGMDADLVAFDPDAQSTVRAEELQHRHKLTPYDGVELHGRVLQTWLRGESVYRDGSFPHPRRGRTLLRRTA